MVRIIVFCLFIVVNLSACCATYLPHRAEIDLIRWNTDGSCKEKSVAGQKMLFSHGIVNRICCGTYCGRRHCWNEAWKNDQWFMCDMSYGKPGQGWPIDQYPQYVREDCFYQPLDLRTLIAERSK